MKKLIIILCCLLLACENFDNKEDRNTNKNNISIQEEYNNNKKRKDNDNIKILPYNGKYEVGEEFFDLAKIVQLRKYMEKILAEKIGLFDEKVTFIEIVYKDWEEKDGSNLFSIIPRTESGQDIWQIHYVTEYLKNGITPSNTVYQLSIAETLLRSNVGGRYQEIPTSIWKGVIFYACNLGDWVIQKSVSDILNNNRILIENAIVGLNSSNIIFPDLEGYLSLVYLQDKYGYSAEKSEVDSLIKKFIYEIFFGTADWYTQISIATGQDVVSFIEGCKTFSVQFLKNRYYTVFLKYNQALKSYIAEDPGSAIAQFQTFILQNPDSFIASDMHFWMAMAYYELKNYDKCIGQLEYIFSANNNGFCHHFALAKYRYAIAFYRLKKFSYALEAFSLFERDFPWEKSFVGSAIFFQGEIFQENNQRERALYEFERFIKSHPGHNRKTEALEKLAYMYMQKERYGRSKVLFEQLSQSSEEKLAEQAIQKILFLEQQGPSSSLRTELDRMVKEYPTLTNVQKKNILKDIAQIGKIALPWLDNLYSINDNLLVFFIDAIVEIGSPSGISVLLKVLNDKSYDQEVFIALLKIGIPATEIKAIIQNEFEKFPIERRKQIQENLENLYWKAPVNIVSKIPSFIENINGSAQQQISTMEKMTIELGAEQIPILKELVKRGKSIEVKVRALNNITLWKNDNDIPFFKSLLTSTLVELRYSALVAISQEKSHDINALKPLLKDPEAKIRKVVLKILRSVDFSDTISDIVVLLDDNNYEISNEAREILLGSPYSATNVFLANGLERQTKSIRYYNYIIEILRLRTRSAILDKYSPQMTWEEKQQLKNELIISWN